MTPFHRTRIFRPAFLGGLIITFCLGFRIQVGAQYAVNTYCDLKKMAARYDSQAGYPVFRNGTSRLPQVAAIGYSVWFRDRLPVLTTDISVLRWSPDDLPFFCRIEHNLGLKTRVPIKFRLGSVDYVDWLEGKRSCSLIGL